MSWAPADKSSLGIAARCSLSERDRICQASSVKATQQECFHSRSASHTEWVRHVQSSKRYEYNFQWDKERQTQPSTGGHQRTQGGMPALLSTGQGFKLTFSIQLNYDDRLYLMQLFHVRFGCTSDGTDRFH